MGKKKIQNFTDLDAWRESYKLVISIYDITKQFPKEEIYGLISQMKRCSVSIASNIAEGFSRRTNKEKAQFYYISHGSLTELQNQIIISKGLKYINNQETKDLLDHTKTTQKLINGLIKYIK